MGDKYANRPGAFCRDLFSNLQGNLTLSPLIDETNCFSDTIRECTADDITGHYTECDLTANTRSYYYSFKPDVQCTGGVSLPSAVVGLPCYQSCEPGSFLPAAQTQCQQCPAGTFSLGGGYFFDLVCVHYVGTVEWLLIFFFFFFPSFFHGNSGKIGLQCSSGRLIVSQQMGSLLKMVSNFLLRNARF